MAAVLFLLLLAAALSLGLRSTTIIDGDGTHPVDRLLAAATAGGILAWAALTLSWRWKVVEAGVGLLLSLAPVGFYDVARWWYRARHPFEPWIIGSRGPAWVIGVRVAMAAALALAFAAAYFAVAGLVALVMP
jgi:hypothetical protein